MNKTIFELPIYSTSQQKFDKWWDEKEAKTKEKLIEKGSDDEIIQLVLDMNFPKRVWKFNQIVGYVVVSISSMEVLFDVFCTLDNRICKDSPKKHFIVDLNANGTHFYVGDKTDIEIKNEIHKWIKAIKKEHLRRQFYLDCSIMENVLPYINIRSMIDDIRKE